LLIAALFRSNNIGIFISFSTGSFGNSTKEL